MPRSASSVTSNFPTVAPDFRQSVAVAGRRRRKADHRRRETKWLYAAIDADSKLLLEDEVFSRRGTDPASGFLHRLTQKRDVSDAEFLTDAGGYLTASARLDLHGGLDYTERNLTEKCFQTVTMRIDRFHSF